MADAADDMEAGGVVDRLFDGLDLPSGSMPQLRLMAALHELVLSGADPELAAFYPSAGGDLSPGDVWPVAHAALQRNSASIREHLERPVQTNEPGRAVVLLAVLLWLGHRHRLPIRLLEIGASGGLNLSFDRYRYEIDGVVLGESRPEAAIAWVGMEPRDAQGGGVEVSLRTHPDAPPLQLASCGDHGPSVVWQADSD